MFCSKLLELFVGLGGIRAVSQQMCFGPIFCQTRTGECCLLVLDKGRVVCPASCQVVKRQDGENGGQEGVSLEDIFYVTLGASLVNNIFMMTFDDTTTPAPIITTITPPTINSTTVQGTSS